MPPRPSLRYRSRQRGVTMIQTAALIALFGSLTAVGVPTFLKTVRRSKVAEASTELERMHGFAAAYYEGVRIADRRLIGCLPEAAGPTPAVATALPTAVDFHADETPGAATWKALAFAPLGPIRFRYSFIPRAAGCDAKSWGTLAVLRAEGDLDGDGSYSLFERQLNVTREHGIASGDVLLMRDRIE